MAADPNRLRYLASKGHFGHSALLDPDTFVSTGAPALGIQVADNATPGPPVKGMESEKNPDLGAISPEYDKNYDLAAKAMNDRMLKSGMSQDEIDKANAGL